MNKRLLTIFLALMAVTVSTLAGDVLINSENFPDEKFREFLLSQNYGEDGKLSERNIESIYEINVQNKGIKSLKGIEFFKYLEVLKCDINDLGSLDVSQNTALKTLSCSICNLQGLDLSKNTALTSLSCINNKDLGALDVSNNKELTFLWCENDGLKSLSVDFNTKLRSLKCSWNQLSSLSLLTNQDLERLECRRNALTELNLTYNEKLTYLDCAGNNINAARMQDIVEALPTYTSGDHTFKVYDDEAETNNVITTKQTSIADGKKWSAQRTSGVGWVGVYGTAIHKTYFPDKKFHQFLLAQDYGKDCLLSNEEVKAITSLDVSGLGIMNLTGIEYFTKLQTLHCENNALTTLNLSKNTDLRKLYCMGNKIQGSGMDELVNSLVTVPETESAILYVCGSNLSQDNVITYNQVQAAFAKRWLVKQLNGETWEDYYGNDAIEINAKNFPDDNFRAIISGKNYDTDENRFLTNTELNAVTQLILYDKGIKDLTGLGFFTKLADLWCGYNEGLKKLDVSKNTELTFLNCSLNPDLGSLDLSKNTKLTQLGCTYNGLTSLDLSANTALTRLDVYGNMIKGAEMDKLVNSLPKTKEGVMVVNCDQAAQDNVITDVQATVAKGKGWKVKRRITAGEGSEVDYAGVGDIDCNGSIDQDDLKLLDKIVMGQQPAGIDKYMGDLNKDGKMNAQDIVILVNILKK